MSNFSSLYRVVWRSLLCCLLLCLFGGCNHREFDTEFPSQRMSVRVEFDWSLDSTAAPKEMTVYFYRLERQTSRPSAYDFAGRDGGNITLTPGVYAAICHNNDSDRHGFVGTESFDSFGLHLNDNRSDKAFQSGGSRDNNDERLAHTPDRMWVGAIAMFEIKSREEWTSEAPQIVRFEMIPVVSHYYFLINNPINFNQSISVAATLSGMAGTVHPAREMTGEETVSHLFELVATPEGNLYGEILTFGHCGNKPVRSEEVDTTSHILTIQAILANGERWTSVHDVTDQIHRSQSHDCVIRLDSISFPQSVGGGGGFNPSVGGWTGSSETVGM